jgi:hypothetical protein
MEGHISNHIFLITNYISAGCMVVLGIIRFLYRRKVRSNISTLLLVGFIFMLSGWPIVFITSFLS